MKKRLILTILIALLFGACSNQNEASQKETEKQVGFVQKEEKAKKYEVNAKNLKDSTEYYNKDAKPGSLASKANMVAKYNEKQANSKKNK